LGPPLCGSGGMDWRSLGSPTTGGTMGFREGKHEYLEFLLWNIFLFSLGEENRMCLRPQYHLLLRECEEERRRRGPCERSGNRTSPSYVSFTGNDRLSRGSVERCCCIPGHEQLDALGFVWVSREFVFIEKILPALTWYKAKFQDLNCSKAFVLPTSCDAPVRLRGFKLWRTVQFISSRGDFAKDNHPRRELYLHLALCGIPASLYLLGRFFQLYGV
jgi:hypothetical protein